MKNQTTSAISLQKQIFERLLKTGPIFVAGKAKELLPKSILADVKDVYENNNVQLHRRDHDFLSKHVRTNKN